jgi:hypothetical protein
LNVAFRALNAVRLREVRHRLRRSTHGERHRNEADNGTERKNADFAMDSHDDASSELPFSS